MRDDDDDRTDNELTDAVRDGDETAFAALFRRHYAAARDFATRFTGPNEAEDRVAEAFADVLRALRRGAGPELSFRPYLFSAVRNAHVDAVRQPGAGEVPVEDLGREAAAPGDLAGDVVDRLDAARVGRAFRRLRPTWRTVLWRTAVLGEPYDEVARRLGSTPQAVASLTYRAREGLRQAYLAEHVREPLDPECRRCAPYLPGLVRGQPVDKRLRSVSEHVADCVHCRSVMQDLVDLNRDLAVVLTPAVAITFPPPKTNAHLRLPRTRSTGGAPEGLSPARVAVSTSVQARTALVATDVTPGRATSLRITAVNAVGLAVVSAELDCPPARSAEGAVAVDCDVRRGGPATFTVSFRFDLVDRRQPAAGTVALAGTDAAIAYLVPVPA